MAAIPPPSRLPNHCSSHFVNVASALRLGDLLHFHGKQVHLRLCSSFREAYHSNYLPTIKDIWCQRPCLLRRCFILQTLTDTFSEACSSCIYFFSGKESDEGFGDNNQRFKTSQGNFFNGRLWTNVLLAVNVLVYAAEVATQGKLILWGAKVNSLIDKGQMWRLVTSSFLHANVGHLMINCYSLNSVGPTMEQLSGARRFLAVYLSSAIASSAMSYWFCQSPAVGASGAIFGLVGSLGVFVLRHRSLSGGGKQDIQQILRVIALNMAIGLLSRGIDNWGHLGGLLGGAAISWFLGPAWKYEFQADDGRLIFADRAPIFSLINSQRKQ